jgi:hypothetical protein
MPYRIILSENFKRASKRLGKKFFSFVHDMRTLTQSLQDNPIQGTPLGKDCYKIRFIITSKGKGKSGSGRVITCVKVIDETVYMLDVFDKSEQENISDKELRSILKSLDLE